VNLRNRAHAIVAFADIPDGGAEGVLLAHGGRFGGYSLFVAEGRLHFAHRYGDGTLYQVSADRPVPTGPVRLGLEFATSGLHQGVATLFLDDQPVGTGPIPRTVPVQYSITGEGLCCGYDDGSAVADYPAPFDFTGTLHKVVVNVSGRPFVDVAMEIERAFRTQ
jgi:arylsulfatase